MFQVLEHRIQAIEPATVDVILAWDEAAEPERSPGGYREVYQHRRLRLWLATRLTAKARHVYTKASQN